jgi:hypothetical protein
VGYGLTFTDTTENYRYRLNDFSSMINFFAGGFIFKTAPLGTAGNIIPYTAAMTILQNGNVGVGPGIPGFRFHIRAAPPSRTPVALIENTTGGDNTNYGLFIKAGTNISTFSYFINFSRPDGLSIGGVMQGSANTVLYLTSSDKRLKNIIGTSQKGLSDLMKIKIYDYTFKSDIEKKVHTGFIAQELYNVFPQSVGKPIDNNESAEKDPWMVDYGSVTPLIIKSVQEQQQIIEDLKKLNDELKKQNEQQKEEIDKLKNIVQVLANKAGLKISSGVFASLEQNIPNPSKGSTTIAYHIPSTNSSAYINFYASSGALLKSVKLDSKSSGTINVKASELPAGVYQYALVVEGKVVDRKQMVQSK